jgi:hypothetical protein
MKYNLSAKKGRGIYLNAQAEEELWGSNCFLLKLSTNMLHLSFQNTSLPVISLPEFLRFRSACF